jgi:hypothetical protein
VTAFTASPQPISQTSVSFRRFRAAGIDICRGYAFKGNIPSYILSAATQKGLEKIFSNLSNSSFSVGKIRKNFYSSGVRTGTEHKISCTVRIFARSIHKVPVHASLWQ